MELLLLAKLVMIFNVGEKVAYGAIGAWMLLTGKKYYKDYRNSIEDEKL
jgi:hypothetical protein